MLLLPALLWSYAMGGEPGGARIAEVYGELLALATLDDVEQVKPAFLDKYLQGLEQAMLKKETREAEPELKRLRDRGREQSGAYSYWLGVRQWENHNAFLMSHLGKRCLPAFKRRWKQLQEQPLAAEARAAELQRLEGELRSAVRAGGGAGLTY